jgi:hypothetical protein
MAENREKIESSERAKKERYETPEIVELGLADELTRGGQYPGSDFPNSKVKGEPAVMGPTE